MPGQKKLLLGKETDAIKIQAYSIEEQITPKYPASYVWQFDHDNTVPIENTQMLVAALKENGIAHEYETFPGTLHGAAEGTDTPAEGWLERAIPFWQAQC